MMVLHPQALANDRRHVVGMHSFHMECSEAVIPVRFAVLQLTRAGAVVDPAAAAADPAGGAVVVHPALQGLAALALITSA